MHYKVYDFLKTYTGPNQTEPFRVVTFMVSPSIITRGHSQKGREEYCGHHKVEPFNENYRHVYQFCAFNFIP